MLQEPRFGGLIISRPRFAQIPLRRAAGIGIACLLYLVVTAGLFLTQLLVLECLKPPEASFHEVPVISWPRMRPDLPDGGDLPAIRGRPRAGTGRGSDAPRAESQGDPPPPLAPPTELSPEPPERTAPIDPMALRRTGPTIGSDPGVTPPGGVGGTGDSGPGGCPDCPEGSGPGLKGPGGRGTIYPQTYEGLIPPVMIPSTRVLPRYPDIARRAHSQGTVILLIIVAADGTVGEVEVLRSPEQLWGFDLAVIEAVKQWRYQPALLNGRPVAVELRVLVEFALSR